MSDRDNFFARFGTKKHSDAAMESSDLERKKLALSNPTIDPKHLDTAMNSNKNELISGALSHPAIDSRHLDTVIDSGNTKFIKSAIKNPNITSKHIDKIIRTNNDELINDVISHPNFNTTHIDYLVDKNLAYKKLLTLPNLKKEHLAKILDNNINDDDTTELVMEHKNIHPNQLEIGLHPDRSFYTRFAAIASANTSLKNLETGLKDESPRIRNVAQSKLNGTYCDYVQK